MILSFPALPEPWRPARGDAPPIASAAGGEVDRFRAFEAAERDMLAAIELCEALEARGGRVWRLGRALAEQRVLRADRRLTIATEAFAGDLPLAAAIWSLPDEV